MKIIIVILGMLLLMIIQTFALFGFYLIPCKAGTVN